MRGDEPSYYRNAFFLHLAGGVSGMNYFCYDQKRPAAWSEVGRLGAVVQELGPMLGAAQAGSKARRPLPPLWPVVLRQFYPFMASIRSPTCWPRTSTSSPSAARIFWPAEQISTTPSCFGTPIGYAPARRRRSTTTFITAAKSFSMPPREVNVPGAQRLDFDLAMGKGNLSQSNPDARFGRPGIVDYNHTDRIALIRDQMGKIAPPPYDSPSDDVVVRPFVGRGVTYLWLVNTHTQQEYEYLRARLGAGVPVADPAKALAEARAFLKSRGVYDKPFETSLTLPAGDFVVCDVLKRHELPVAADGPDGSGVRSRWSGSAARCSCSLRREWRRNRWRCMRAKGTCQEPDRGTAGL